jgi:hypothetical protein
MKWSLMAAAALAIAGIARPAAAHILPDYSIDQLTRQATVVLEGEVMAVASDWSADHTRIYTNVRIRVAHYHKGNLGQETLTLRLLGGTVGEITLAVVGQPGFERNEKVFLFLQPNFQTRDIPFVGGEEGKLRVVPSAAGDVLLGPHQTFEKSVALDEIRAVLRPIGQ